MFGSRRVQWRYERQTRKEARRLEEAFFGHHLTGRQYADLTGAPRDSTIVVGADSANQQITIAAANLRYGFSQYVTFQRVDESLTLAIVQCGISEEQPKGIGARVLARVVGAARDHGFKEIFLIAAGNVADPGFNGYYTWPRLGFVGDLRDIDGMAEKLKDAGFEGVSTTTELFRRTGGIAWWRQNGESLFCAFDLDPASDSSVYLRIYLDQEGVFGV